MSKVIQTITEQGFIALAAYMYILAFVSMVLFIAAAVANVFLRSSSHFDLSEIRKLFIVNVAFSTVFSLLDYFLI